MYKKIQSLNIDQTKKSSIFGEFQRLYSENNYTPETFGSCVRQITGLTIESPSFMEISEKLSIPKPVIEKPRRKSSARLPPSRSGSINLSTLTE